MPEISRLASRSQLTSAHMIQSANASDRRSVSHMPYLGYERQAPIQLSSGADLLAVCRELLFKPGYCIVVHSSLVELYGGIQVLAGFFSVTESQGKPC